MTNVQGEGECHHEALSVVATIEQDGALRPLPLITSNPRSRHYRYLYYPPLCQLTTSRLLRPHRLDETAAVT